MVPEEEGDPLEEKRPVKVAEPPEGLKLEEALTENVPVPKGDREFDALTVAVGVTQAVIEGEPVTELLDEGVPVTDVDCDTDGVPAVVGDAVADLLAVEDPQSVPVGEGVPELDTQPVGEGVPEVDADTVGVLLPVSVAMLVGEADTVPEADAEADAHAVEDAVREGVPLLVVEGVRVGEAREDADAVLLPVAHADTELEQVPVVLPVPEGEWVTVEVLDTQYVFDGDAMLEKLAIGEYVGEGEDEAHTEKEREVEGQDVELWLGESVGLCEDVPDAEAHTVRVALPARDGDADGLPVPHALAVVEPVTEPDTDAVGHNEGDAVEEGVCDTDALCDREPHGVGEAEGHGVTEGEAQVRVADIDALRVPDPQGEGVDDALGDREPLPLPHADAVVDCEGDLVYVTHTDTEGDALKVALAQKLGVTLAHAECDRVLLAQKVEVVHEEALTEKLTLTVGLAVCEGEAVPQGLADTVGDCDGEGVPQAVAVELPVPEDVAEDVAVACRRRAAPGLPAPGPSSSKRHAKRRGGIRKAPKEGGPPPRGSARPGGAREGTHAQAAQEAFMRNDPTPIAPRVCAALPLTYPLRSP